MYAEFFGLRELPFNNTPDPRFFYSTPDHEEAMASLVYAVQERKGFALLTGEVGAGKTLVSRMMLRHFGNRIVFANINHAVGGASDLLASLCTEFDMSIPDGASNSQMVRLLHDFLLSRFAQDVPSVLVLDEAQSLPDEAFEQLRMIGNLEADDAKLLQIVIVGQPELQARFQLPQLRQLRQRIFRSFHLPALTQSLTEAYIQHRLDIAGSQDVSVFDGFSIERIYDQSKGLPRLINAICDNAMLSAYSANRRLVDGPFVESVIRQMMLFEQQTFAAPAPMGYAPVAAPQAYQQTYAAPMVAVPVPVAAAPAPVAVAPAPTSLPMPIVSVSRSTVSTDVSGNQMEEFVTMQVQRAMAVAYDDMQMKLRCADQRISQLEEDRHNRVSTVGAAEAACADLWPLIEQAKAIVEKATSGSEVLSEREARIAKMAGKLKKVIEEIRRINTGLGGSIGKARSAERHAQAVFDRLCRQSERSQQVAQTLRTTISEVDRREAAIESQVSLLAQASSSAKAVACGVGDVERFEQVLRTSESTLTDLRDLASDENDTSEDARVGSPKTESKRSVVGPSTARLSQQVEGLLRFVGSTESSSAKISQA